MTTEPDATRRTQILIVDDDDDTRGVVCDLLAGEGYSIRCATDGEEALERVKECQPELLILDLMMPRMNGWEVLEALRADPPANPPEVLVFSAARNGMDEEIEGATHVKKPVELEDFLEVVAELLSRTNPGSSDASASE